MSKPHIWLIVNIWLWVLFVSKHLDTFFGVTFPHFVDLG